jgi:signal transduction histidine kinase
MKLRLLHLEDNGADVELVRMTLARDGVDCDILAVSSGAAYLAALKQPHFDAVLSDSAIPGYDGGAALLAARNRFPEIPFIVVSGNPGVSDPHAASGENPTARVAKSELHRLGAELRLAVSRPKASTNVLTNLERKVAELTAEAGRRNTEIEVLNKELEAFSYSVAHDLRSPLITIDGFAQVLLENTTRSLDETNRDHLQRISTAARRMHRLINDLLDLSKIVRAPLHRGTVDLSKLAREILQTLRDRAPSRLADLVVAESLVVSGDSGLLRIALDNLLANAWKFTSRKDRTHIEFGSGPDHAGRTVYFVRDNGAGFDPRYATKLFSPFQRLHSETQFPGTGIGLATVRRIIHRHGGEIWAESAVDCGAGFYFTLALSD